MSRQIMSWHGLFAQPSAGDETLWRYNECWASSGFMRPAWQRFVDEAHAYAPDPFEVSQRLEQTIVWRQMHFQRYNHDKTQGLRWPLDPLPVLIEANEWSFIERAVQQRVTLLNTLLADLYGPQRLIAEGLVPPALVYGQSEYIWGLQNISPLGGRYILMYAVDLARAADGHWWVMSDRTGAPSGLGYMLENRQIMNLAYDGLADRLGTRSIEASVRQWFAALRTSLADAFAEDPLLVLLSPGPAHETYHEQVFLASFLGIALVEGDDLLVRAETLFMRTEQGLARVHGVIRRLDSMYCDPLELRSDSALGIPGLSQAIRAGRVCMANALGSGILDAPGLLAFLPAIARYLLGEDLLLPAVATWWCGEASARHFVLDHLHALNLSPAFTHQHMNLIQSHTWSERSLYLWKQKIQGLPQAYVAQELVSLSTTPFLDVSLEPMMQNRPMGLRVFVLADGKAMRVIPGGLVRVASHCKEQVISMQRGGRPKDVWIQADIADRSTDVYVFGGRRQPRSASRLEHVFWLGRYLERWHVCARECQQQESNTQKAQAKIEQPFDLTECDIEVSDVNKERCVPSTRLAYSLKRMHDIGQQIYWQLQRLASEVPRPWLIPEAIKQQALDPTWIQQRYGTEGDEWEPGWVRNCFLLGRAVESLIQGISLCEGCPEFVDAENHAQLGDLIQRIQPIMSFWPDTAWVWERLQAKHQEGYDDISMLKKESLAITEILNERLFWLLPESSWRVRS